MKKVLIVFTMFVMCASCNNFSNSNNSKNTEETDDTPSQELIEYANQYHLNIDTTKTYDLNIKVLQTLDDNDCLAHECSNKQYGWYNGQLIYYMSSDMLYDDKIVKEKAYLIGTYKYKTIDTLRKYRTVPFYCEINEYENLKKDGFFDFIIEIQDY